MYLLKNREYYISDGNLYQIDIAFKMDESDSPDADDKESKGYYLMICELEEVPGENLGDIILRRLYKKGDLYIISHNDEESDELYQDALEMKDSFLNRIEDTSNIFFREEIDVMKRIELNYNKNTEATKNHEETLRILKDLRVKHKNKERALQSSMSKNDKQSNDDSFMPVDVPNITFEDVAGLKEVKEELIQVVDYMKNRKKYKNMGVELEKGILLHGPPGTGKTLIAKALAKETNSKFFEVSGSEFVEKYVGVGAKRVRELFKTAKKQAPSIIFIDEIDAVGGERSSEKNGEMNNTLNQLLVELDGFKQCEDVLIIGASNRLDSLDSALIRAGRLGEHIYIGNPDFESRKELFFIHTKNKPLDTSVDLEKLARKTHGFNGASIKAMCNTAGLLAIREDKDKISAIHFEKALDKAIVGLHSKTKKIIDKEKLVVAYHEAGHAIVGKLTGDEEIGKISIIPAGTALGFVYKLASEDSYLSTKKELLGRIKTLLAGKVAEEIFFKEATNGASNDLQKASNIALKMVNEYGMDSNNGLLSISTNGKPSEDEIKRAEAILKECYKDCFGIIEEHKDALEMVAQELIKKEELSGEDFNVLLKNFPSFN